jgi:hypothetical protein
MAKRKKDTSVINVPEGATARLKVFNRKLYNSLDFGKISLM